MLSYGFNISVKKDCNLLTIQPNSILLKLYFYLSAAICRLINFYFITQRSINLCCNLRNDFDELKSI